MKNEKHTEVYYIKGEDLAKISYNDFMQDISRLSAFCDLLACVNNDLNSPVSSVFAELSKDLINIASKFNNAYDSSIDFLENARRSSKVARFPAGT